MICYRDMTFCTHYKDCKKRKECGRALTPKVQKDAKAFGLPCSYWAEKPDCWEKE